MQKPKISIITPSFNQGQFIEKTILSVLNQSYKNIEYIIIDGASTDNTVDIIKKYEDKIFYWESTSDKGQYDAINKGFKKATGDIFCFINSDDYFLPGAFEIMAKAYKPGLHWWNGNAKMLYKSDFREHQPMKYINSISYLQMLYRPVVLPQVSVFWTRELWNSCGKHMKPLFYGLDYELFFRFSQKTNSIPVKEFLAVYLSHENAKTGMQEGIQKWINETNKIRIEHLSTIKLPLPLKRLFIEFGTRYAYAKSDGWSKLLKKGEVFDFFKNYE